MSNELLAWRLDTLLMLCVSIAIVAIARRLVGRNPEPSALRALHRAALLLLPIAGAIGADLAGHTEQARLQQLVEGFAPTYAQVMAELGCTDLTVDVAPDDPRYLRLIDAQKRWLAVNPAVADIYTFVKQADGTLVLFVDSETDYDGNGIYDGEREQRTTPGEAYDPTPEIEAAFAGQASFEATPCTDRWGTWVTALVPIRRADGSVHSVLGVDYPAEHWVTSILTMRAAVLVVALLLLTLVVIAHSLFLAGIGKARALAETRARQQFLAHMSHEIRTPMTAILGHADLLADEDAATPERRRCVATIRRSGQHLMSVLDDILDLAKLEAGIQPVRLDAVALAELVGEVLDLHTANARHKGLDLHADLGAELPSRITTDPRMMRQILINLVGNAVKFTTAGRIEVAVHLAARADGTRLVCDVSDSGPGIAPADQKRLFQSFVQGEAGLGRSHGGTGLGLSLSRRMARQLGGDITVHSRLGLGSTFTLDLPCTPAADRAIAPEAAAPAPTPAPLAQVSGRLLVVDDGPDNRALLAAVLKKSGYDVECVPDGEQCLDRLAGDGPPPDLILMDVQMPGLDGHETTRRLRRQGYRGPIVAVTAHALPEDRALCIEAGCSDYVSKPIDRHLLLTAIQRHLTSAPPT